MVLLCQLTIHSRTFGVLLMAVTVLGLIEM